MVLCFGVQQTLKERRKKISGIGNGESYGSLFEVLKMERKEKEQKVSNEDRKQWFQG